MKGSLIQAKALLLCLLFIAGPLFAGTISGSVATAQGRPIAGATVTLTDANGYSESVYTDRAGKFVIRTQIQGKANLRVRAYGFSDIARDAQPARGGNFQFRLQHYADKLELSNALPASAHAASIRWEDPKIRTDFVSQCQFCHQIGNEWTRRPRNEEQWEFIINKMQGYGSVITYEDEKVFRRTLAASFQGQPLDTVITPDVSNELPRAKVREWAFGAGVNYVHDVELGRDELLYGVDMSTDRLWILDQKTNKIEQIELPPNDLPLGGKFEGGVAPLGTFAARHGPHSIVEGPDGKLYMTCSLAAEIGIFDPVSRKFEFVATGGDTLYPHTLRFDKKGMLWFTFALSNQIGRMNPATKEIKVIDLQSHGFWAWLADAMLPTILRISAWFGKKDMYVALSHHKISGEGYHVLNLPYGIDINPVDGSVWFSKLYASYIGRVDPETLEVTEYETPRKAPRRLRFDPQGNLWIPSFEEGYLMKFNAVERRFEKEYRLPLLAPNQYETPYALNIHPKTGEIWITSNLSDRWFRFNPRSEVFISYPSPTRVTFMRDFIFLPDGQACSSNSNLPAAAIEGGRPKIMCIDPGEIGRGATR